MRSRSHFLGSQLISAIYPTSRLSRRRRNSLILMLKPAPNRNVQLMSEELSHQLVELVYQAALQSFWRKDALKRFLRRCGISERYIARLSSAERKRDWLDRLFPDLENSGNGKKAIVKMAAFLSEQTSFPDLETCEDSEDKIRKARVAVNNLQVFLSKANLDKQKGSSEAVPEKTPPLLVRAQAALKDLEAQLQCLTPQLGTQKGGYDFQTWFYNFADLMEIDNRRPYVSNGRQIDGSLTVDGTTYLVELKFTKEQASATDVDSLKAKVNSKADNTMAVMVSMSGYSSTAMSEASYARTPLLLLDYSHIYLVLGGSISLSDLIRRLRRHSSQTGEALLPVAAFGE